MGARKVTKGPDGFFRVEGLDDEIYYPSEAVAVRVAANLDKKDKPETPPAPPPPKK